MTAFVLDASIALCWCFDDEEVPGAWQLLEPAVVEGALVPVHWKLEVANALAVAERRRRADWARIRSFLALLQQLSIAIDDATNRRAFGPILACARDRRLSAYDAAYLDLSERSALPLASWDTALRDAARAIGLAVLPP